MNFLVGLYHKSMWAERERKTEWAEIWVSGNGAVSGGHRKRWSVSGARSRVCGAGKARRAGVIVMPWALSAYFCLSCSAQMLRNSMRIKKLMFLRNDERVGVACSLTFSVSVLIGRIGDYKLFIVIVWNLIKKENNYLNIESINRVTLYFYLCVVVFCASCTIY